MTDLARQRQLTSLNLLIFQHSCGPHLTEASLAAMHDEDSQEYKSWFDLFAQGGYSDEEIKELQAEVARFTLRGDAGGSLEHLLAYLRTVARTGQIHPSVAELICLAIDPQGDTDMQLVLSRRSKRGRPLSSSAERRGFEAARQVENLVDGMSKEAAVADIVRISGLSTSQIYEWCRRRVLYGGIVETPDFIEACIKSGDAHE